MAVRSVWRSCCAGIAIVTCLAACGGGAGDGAGAGTTDTPGSGVTSITTPATPSTTSGAATTAPSGAVVSAANSALSASLGTLSGAVRELENDDALRKIKATVASATGDGRRALAAVRSAAYPAGSRNCTKVAAGVASAMSASTAAAKASAGAAVGKESLSAGEAAVAKARAQVVKDLDALTAALAKSPGTPTISEKDVQAALQAADEARAASQSARSSLGGQVSSDVAQAKDFVSTAQRIAYQIC